ncbi:MAG: hypothetical protein RIR52_1691 [Acidobacteriota bacterium]
MKRRILALILGGGQGSRLFPLTRERSKPAVPLGGKYRLIDITVSNCINSDIHHIYVLTQFNSASLNRHISQTYRFSGFSSGFVEILAAEQTPENKNWFQGTADAVRQVMIHINDFNPEHVLILSGDHLYQMNYLPFLEQHLRSNADVTISVIPTDESRASSFGLVRTNDDGDIVEFREKPPRDQLSDLVIDPARLRVPSEELPSPCYLASMGVYFFKISALHELLADDRYTDFGGEVIPAAIDRFKVQSFLFSKYWEDIGTISSFFHANLNLAIEMPRFNLFDADSPIYTRRRFLPSTKFSNCQIDLSLVSDGCILNHVSISQSVIGIRSRIEERTRLDRTLMMGADFYQNIDDIKADRRAGRPPVGIGSNTIISKAIIDKNVRIGDNCRIVNQHGLEYHDDDNYYIREGIIIIPKGATIPHGTII